MSLVEKTIGENFKKQTYKLTFVIPTTNVS